VIEISFNKLLYDGTYYPFTIGDALIEIGGIFGIFAILRIISGILHRQMFYRSARKDI
jgi:hypothetical protein